jgi:drug/metabolite transporter (DMT)-like permease
VKRATGGLWHMVGAAFFFSLMSLLVRLSGESMPSSQVVLARAVVALVISWAMLRRLNLTPFGPHKGLLALRGLLGFGGLTCFYYSLVHLPLAEATVIQYMNPVFTALIAAVVLRERLRAADLLATVCSLLGVALVARPAFLFGAAGHAPLDPVAVAVALLGAVLSAAAYVSVRKAKGLAPPLVVVFWFPLFATPLALPPALVEWVWPSATGWLLLLGVGVTTQVAQVFMTEGLHREPAGRATAISYLQVLFAGAWGAMLLGELPDASTLAGAALVCAGVLAVAVQRPHAPPRAPSPTG